jgi:DNA polymerase I-like protein with 3'-5' exonuclease and polymerase domains
MRGLDALGFDVETWGELQEYALQPFRSVSGLAGVRAASFAKGEAVTGLLNPAVEKIRGALKTAASKGMYVTGWNITFDAAWCIAAGLEEEVFACKWLDAMLLWRHWFIKPEGENVPTNKRKSYALKAALAEFFPDQGEFKEFDDFQATDEESLQKLLLRNKGDALFTLKLAQLFWSRLNERQRNAALIEARCIPMVARTLIQGITSNAVEAKSLSSKLMVDAKRIHAELLKLSPEAAEVNFGSPKQLQDLLYKTWGLPQTRNSKKGAPSTDKYALFDLAPLDPRARMLKELREAKNNRTKYAEATLKSLEYNGDGCTRPAARIFGTYTGRMTYNSRQKSHNGQKQVILPVGVALHQWKRGKDYRRLIQVPEGYTLAEFDFSGQEFRWMAVASKDETMLSLCLPGEDAHSYMAAAIHEMDYRELIALVGKGDAAAELIRKLGKFANLSFQYRVSARTATLKARVDYELDIDEPFVKQILSVYKQTFSGVGGQPTQKDGGYWGDQIQKCKGLGYAETFAGRRVQLLGYWSGDDRWPLESTAINYPIQGTGADQKYLAMAVLRNLLPKYESHFYFELHDGLFVIIPDRNVQAAAAEIKQALSNLPYKKAWGVNLPISFPVDAKVGPTWGDLKGF